MKQGDLFYSAGLHGKLRLPKLTQLELGRGLGRNEDKWTGKVEIRARNKFLAVGEQPWLYPDVLQTLKGERLSALCSQQRGP